MAPKIILHHLDHSRSERVIWLLEELELPYEIKFYFRKGGRAPKGSKDVHPLGRFPMVEIYPNGNTTETPIFLTETGYICNYLVEHYDTNNKLLPKDETDRETAKFYSYYSEGSLQNHLVSLMISSRVVAALPPGISFLAGKIFGLANDAYYLPEVRSHFEFLEEQLARSKGDYFVGEQLTYADIILSFPIYDNTLSHPAATKANLGIDIEKFPNLHKWVQKIEASPIRKRVHDEITAKAKPSL